VVTRQRIKIEEIKKNKQILNAIEMEEKKKG
jgi:hypothetical protein